jgi:GNAT superfamily N-acetyltransferase
MEPMHEPSVASYSWRSPDGFVVTTAQARLDFEVIFHAIAESYWARGISRTRLKKAIEHSLAFGAYEDDKFVGFARIITDHATYAYLCDVFVVPEARGRGISKALMAAIVAHPDLQELRRWSLATRDAHGLYSRFGFKPLSAPELYMERWEPGVYERLAAEGRA